MKARRTKSRGPKLLVVITRGLIRSIKHSTFCLEQYELYEGFQRGWEVRVGGGKDDSNCTVSASVPMKSHSQQQGGVMLGTVLLMLYCIYTAEWREGWVDSGNRWAGKWPLLLPSTPHPPPSYYYYTALMHTLFPHKVATTNPLLLPSLHFESPNSTQLHLQVLLLQCH